MEIHIFEQPCPSGWIYPCSLDDITCSLGRLPEQDLEGLWAVGLVPSTPKDNNAYGRYYWHPKPTIHIYSYPASLRFKLRPHTKLCQIQSDLAVELDYGMEIERDGSRFLCVWSMPNLRRFLIEHVLLHEVGHHVYFWQRKRKGYAYKPHTEEAEQFAEAYALRYRRQHT